MAIDISLLTLVGLETERATPKPGDASYLRNLHTTGECW